MEFDGHVSLEGNEDLVSIVMAMPDEVALKFHKLEMIVVHLGNDLG